MLCEVTSSGEERCMERHPDCGRRNMYGQLHANNRSILYTNVNRWPERMSITPASGASVSTERNGAGLSPHTPVVKSSIDTPSPFTPIFFTCTTGK